MGTTSPKAVIMDETADQKLAVPGIVFGAVGTAGLRWLLAAMACGAGFGVVKLAEYAAKLNQGIDLTSNTFYTLYLMLTAFHFLHVVVAMLALGYLAVRLQRGAYGSHDSHAMETGAAFWHMVDLLWIVLFPLVYVLR